MRAGGRLAARPANGDRAPAKVNASPGSSPPPAAPPAGARRAPTTAPGPVSATSAWAAIPSPSAAWDALPAITPPTTAAVPHVATVVGATTRPPVRRTDRTCSSDVGFVPQSVVDEPPDGIAMVGFPGLVCGPQSADARGREKAPRGDAFGHDDLFRPAFQRPAQP